MKKLLIVLFLCLGLIRISAQNLISHFQFGGSGDNQVIKSVIDKDNNIYIIGQFSGIVNAGGTNYTAYGTGNDIYIAKINQSGSFVWFKQIGSYNQNDQMNGLTLSADENSILIAGSYSGSPCTFWNGYSLTNYSSGTADAFLASISTSDGSINNLKRIVYGAAGQVTQSIKVDKYSNIIIIGYVVGNGNKSYFSANDSIVCNGPYNYYILSLNSSFDVNWIKKTEGNDGSNNFYSVDVDDDGYYISGMNKGTLTLDIATLISQNNSIDMFLYKTDFNGNGQWVRSIKGSGNDVSVYTTCDKLGHIYISGYYASTDLKVDSTATLQSLRSVSNNGSNDIFFAKYKTDGSLVWFDHAGSTGDDRLTRLSTNGSYIVIAGQYGGAMTFGNQTITPKGGIDAFGVVHDENDNPLYAVSAGGSGTDIFQTCLLDNTGNYFFIGQGYSPTTYFSDTEYVTNSTPATRDVFIAKYNKASISIVKSDITCIGSNNGSANAVPKGAIVQPLTYAWTKKGDVSYTAATASISSLTSGRYYVTAVDAIGYSMTDSADISDPIAISLTVSSTTNASCYNGSNGTIDITVSGGTAPYTYAWTANGGSGVNAMVQDQTTLTAGSYSVLITDKNGCTATLSNIVISQPNKVTFTGTVVTKINGNLGSIDLSVHGGTPAYTYSWSGPLSYVAFADDISGLADAGSYIVTVTDANLCKADTNFYVADAYSLNVYLASKENVKCKGGSDGSITIATANVVGFAKYVWTGSTSCTAVANNLSAGNYSVTVTDDLYSEVVDVTITEPATDLTVSISKTDITCNNANNGVADANPLGGTLPYSYSWTHEAVAYDGNNETLTGLSEGAYAVTVTDVNGCSASNTQTIINPAIITFTGNVTSITCENGKNDGLITLSNIQGGTGSYSYLWSNGITTKTDSLLSAGNYTITITDANNCKSSNNYVVGYGASLSLSVSETNVTCNGSANGIATAEASGGYGGFTYKWSNDATTETITALAPKTYTVTITDSKLCTKSQTVTITEPEVLAIASTNQTNVSCFGRSDGSISVTATGGSPGYFYQWDNGAGTLATASGLPAATYNLTITDLNSCKVTGTYIITEPATLGVTEDATLHTNLLCNGSANGSVTLIATGGSGTYQFSANSGAWMDVPSFTGLTAGNYTFVVRDKAAVTCSFSMPSSVSISEPTAITIGSPVKSDITCYGLSNGTITATGNGGTGTLVYSLKLAGVLLGNTTGSASGSFTGLIAGDDYRVEVTDANNCNPAISNNISLAQASLLKIVLDSAYKATQKSPEWNGHIEVVAEGGTSPYTYTLSTAVVNQTGIFATLAPGNYTVIVNDANSCGPLTTHTLVVDDATSVTLINQGVLSFFPNPTTDYLIVKFDGLKQQDLVIEFISITGVTIHKEKIESGVLQSGTYTIDLQGIAKGLYLLKVNGIFAKEKILLQ